MTGCYITPLYFRGMMMPRDPYDVLGLKKSDKPPTQAVVDAAYRRTMLALKTALIAGDPAAARKMLENNLARDDFKKRFGKQWAAEVAAREIVQAEAKKAKPVEVRQKPVETKPAEARRKPAAPKPQPPFTSCAEDSSMFRRPDEPKRAPGNWVKLSAHHLPVIPVCQAE